MRQSKQQPVIRHAIALGYGVNPIYEHGEIVGWQPTEGTKSRARAIGRYIATHPKQFGSKTEPSIVGVSGGYPGVALPGNPVPPHESREAIFMYSILKDELSITPNIVDLDSQDTMTNGSKSLHAVRADAQFDGMEFSTENAIGFGANWSHFLRIRPIMARTFLQPETDPTAIQLISTPGAGFRGSIHDCVGAVLVHGMFDQLETNYGDPLAMDAASKVFEYVVHESTPREKVLALLGGLGVPLPEQPYVQVARDFLAQAA